MHQILMIFAQMLEIVALSDLASVLCARKFSFAPQGGVPEIALFSFIIIGLSALAEGPMDSRSSVRSFVRSFVRDAISGDPRIRFF